MQQRQPHTHLTCGFCIRSKPHQTKARQPFANFF